MDSTEVATKPHAVCIPFPAQSHIKAMLKFAKLLHRRGFHITFVNTEFNHKRFLKSLGPNSLDGLPDFQFEAIPDSLPDSNEDTTQDVTLLSACSFMGIKQLRTVVEKGLAPLKDESCFTNGYLDTVIDWIPGMRDIRLRDLPTFLRTTNPDEIVFNFIMEATDRAHEASALLSYFSCLGDRCFGCSLIYASPWLRHWPSSIASQ
ncbi:7-deoxyloganetin glucosyltransferase-like isoform X1 [Prunus yedoensis var. nudiflora]|uniref:7-deoxyloganetin glucosyltransferase-like isoform X1 n=1 Tax=Prunus yedoensis var. nudiflora TaxID=2094558 RepID=A0A314Y4J4_PRUYE|nr:7-deoxyloganetin glucosyltransferase-like isoform X1 [Prunus yedoensis var. nudiflora]